MVSSNMAERAVIARCRVVDSSVKMDEMGVEHPIFGIQLIYTDGMQVFLPDVSTKKDEVETLSLRLCEQDVGADMIPYIVYDYLCSLSN